MNLRGFPRIGGSSSTVQQPVNPLLFTDYDATVSADGAMLSTHGGEKVMTTAGATIVRTIPAAHPIEELYFYNAGDGSVELSTDDPTNFPIYNSQGLVDPVDGSVLVDSWTSVKLVKANGQWRVVDRDGSAAASGSGASSSTFTQPLGSRYLLAANRFSGWAADGIIDQTMTVNLGSVGGTIPRAAGGLTYPFDVQIKRLFAWHYNSNGAALPWGWRIARQVKNVNSYAVSHTDILRQCVGTGASAVAPNDYGNNRQQQTDIDLSGTDPVPSGEVIVFGVEAPTATGTYNVLVMSGFIEMERV